MVGTDWASALDALSNYAHPLGAVSWGVELQMSSALAGETCLELKAL